MLVDQRVAEVFNELLVSSKGILEFSPGVMVKSVRIHNRNLTLGESDSSGKIDSSEVIGTVHSNGEYELFFRNVDLSEERVYIDYSFWYKM